MTPTSIELHAPKLALRGVEVVVKGDGPSLELTDKARILAKSLKLYGEASSIELERKADIRGDKVLINCRAQPPLPTDEAGNVESIKLSVRLTDALAQPYEDKHYELKSGSLSLEGTTGAGGLIEHDLPKSARIAQVELWIGKYPAGERRTYLLELSPLPPIDCLEGLRGRLKNLGYYEGPLEGEALDAPTAAAIRRFQREHKIEDSGVDDDATQTALVARHGN
jgi:hypothetical protein